MEMMMRQLTKNEILWDRDIQKERERKKLGLSPTKRSESAISVTDLKYEIIAIKSRLDDLSEQISDIKNTLEAVIPDTQELIKDVITGIIREQD